MASTEKPLPDFDRPPVMEVALGVQFDDLPGLNAFQIAGFWTDHLKAEFPDVAEQPPLTNVEEVFGQPERRGRALSVQVGPPTLRFGACAGPAEPVRFQLAPPESRRGVPAVPVREEGVPAPFRAVHEVCG